MPDFQKPSEPVALAGRRRRRGQRILIVTDAWEPQVNGVVRTLRTVAHELRAMGHAVEVIGPDRFRTVPCPTYPASAWPCCRAVGWRA